MEGDVKAGHARGNLGGVWAGGMWYGVDVYYACTDSAITVLAPWPLRRLGDGMGMCVCVCVGTCLCQLGGR